MSTQPIDYSALAKQFGGFTVPPPLPAAAPGRAAVNGIPAPAADSAPVNYTALAKQFGATSSTTPEAPERFARSFNKSTTGAETPGDLGANLTAAGQAEIDSGYSLVPGHGALQIMKGAHQQMSDVWNRAVDDFSKGNVTTAQGLVNYLNAGIHAVESGVPFVGPMLSQADKQLSAGNAAGAAGTVVGAALPFAAGAAGEAAGEGVPADLPEGAAPITDGRTGEPAAATSSRIGAMVKNVAKKANAQGVPGAVIGGGVGSLIPVPGATAAGALIGRELWKEGITPSAVEAPAVAAEAPIDQVAVAARKAAATARQAATPPTEVPATAVPQNVPVSAEDARAAFNAKRAQMLAEGKLAPAPAPAEAAAPQTNTASLTANDAEDLAKALGYKNAAAAETAFNARGADWQKAVSGAGVNKAVDSVIPPSGATQGANLKAKAEADFYLQRGNTEAAAESLQKNAEAAGVPTEGERWAAVRQQQMMNARGTDRTPEDIARAHAEAGKTYAERHALQDEYEADREGYENQFRRDGAAAYREVGRQQRALTDPNAAKLAGDVYAERFARMPAPGGDMEVNKLLGFDPRAIPGAPGTAAPVKGVKPYARAAKEFTEQVTGKVPSAENTTPVAATGTTPTATPAVQSSRIASANPDLSTFQPGDRVQSPGGKVYEVAKGGPGGRWLHVKPVGAPDSEAFPISRTGFVKIKRDAD